MPHPDIDNYNALTAPSYFDYQAVLVDPASITRVAGALLEEGAEFEAHDGRPVVNAASTATSVSAADQFRRRLDETQRLLDRGGTVVVLARPNAVQTGIVGFEGCDRYSWLPAPASMSWGAPYLRAAEGQTLRVTAEDHPFAAFLREYRADIAYRAVFDDRQQAVRQGRVVATGNTDVPIAMEFTVGSGRVLFIPAIKDNTYTSRTDMAEKLFIAVRGMAEASATPDLPYWARTVAVPGLEQVEAQMEEAEQAVAADVARRDVVRERLDELAAHRRLLTDDGLGLSAATRRAFELLGFAVQQSDATTGIVIESEGQVAFVESEGAGKEVVEWPYIRLQRRLEKRLLEQGERARGIVIANGQRTRPPDEREGPRFTDALRIACENYRYCLMTSETLFALVQRALGGADESALAGVRRRIMVASGLLEGPVALGEVEESQDTGPIF
jgi:hypothetical protein